MQSIHLCFHGIFAEKKGIEDDTTFPRNICREEKKFVKYNQRFHEIFTRNFYRKKKHPRIQRFHKMFNRQEIIVTCRIMNNQRFHEIFSKKNINT